MSEIINKTRELRDLEKKIKENRTKFTEECFILKMNDPLLNELKVKRWTGEFHSKFLNYLMTKEKNDEIKIILKRIRWDSDRNNSFYISNENGYIKGYRKAYIYFEKMRYKEWQLTKKALLLVKKHIIDYIFVLQKKRICTLTDCYNDEKLDRYCEFCGKVVKFDHIYCSECGKKWKS